MGEEQRIQLTGLEGERQPVALRLLGRSLEHAAVDQHPPLADGDEELRAGDAARRAEELDADAHEGPTGSGTKLRSTITPSRTRPMN